MAPGVCRPRLPLLTSGPAPSVAARLWLVHSFEQVPLRWPGPIWQDFLEALRLLPSVDLEGGMGPGHQATHLDYVTLIGWGTGSLNRYPISLWGTLLG